MMNMQHSSRPLTAVCTGLLVCAVVACGRRDDTANRGTPSNAAAVTDSNATSSIGGTVAIATPDAMPAAADTAGYAHQPIPGARQTTAATAARRTSSMGGAVPARRTARRASVVAVAAATPEPLVVITGVRDEDYLAEPQIYTVVLLANIGDSTTSSRAVCLPSVNSNEHIRAFAQRMVREHADLNQKIVALQRTNGIAPTRSPVSDEVFSANSDAMGSNENAQNYLAREVRSHQSVLSTLDTKLIPNARDTTLRAALIGARQLVASHLADAQMLQNGGANQPASAINQPAAQQPATAGATVTVAPQQTPVLSGQVTATPKATTNVAPSTRDTMIGNMPVVTTAPTGNPPAGCEPAPTITPVTTPPMNQLNTPTPIRPDTTRGYDSRVLSEPMRVPPDTVTIRP